jgi:hypothetical protein
MNDQKSQGFLSAIAVPIGEELQHHHALPPYQKAVARASYGASLLGLCGFPAVVFDQATFPPVVIMVWAGVSGLGLLLLVVGVKGARGPRDVMTAFWSIALPAGGWWGLSAWQGPQVFNNIWVQWIATAVLFTAAVRLFLALRGMPGDARKMVDADIQANEFNWNAPPPKRKFWQG